MYSTAFLFRLAKTISVFAIGLMALLVVFGNVTDYDSNYFFVAHVMKMDTIFPGSHVHYRAISHPVFFHAAYIFIILLEAAMAVCCLYGSWKLYRNLKADAAVFYTAKNWAVAGILIGIVLFFLGFEVIGGEWFVMWQSSTANGLASAERIVSFLVLSLILLHARDE